MKVREIILSVVCGLVISGGMVYAAHLLHDAWFQRSCDSAFDVDVGVTMCIEKAGCFYDADNFVQLRQAEQSTRQCKLEGWTPTR